MFLIGLYDSPSKSVVDSSSGVFSALHKLVYMSRTLFPPLGSIKFLNLNNRFSGPVNCAADDLELTFGNDQIEFTSAAFRRPSGVPGAAQLPVKNSHSFDASLQLHDHFGYLGKSWHPTVPNGANPNGANANANSATTTGVNHASVGFGLNRFGYDVETFDPPMAGYFDDFAPHHSETVDDSVYGSSAESYVSPLDDEFFRRVGSSPESYDSVTGSFSAPVDRKRKYQESPQSSVSMSVPSFDEVDVLFNQILVKNQPEMAYVPQKINQPNHRTQTEGSAKRTKKVKHEDQAMYQCEHCDASFKVKGYLTRHTKKHNVAKAFVCPFYQDHPADDSGVKCHPNGGFSRRDTFKTHLKAIHFIYPPGTKSSERRTRGGRCAGCFQQFSDNKEWLKDHVEAGKCKAAINQIEVTVKKEWVD
ncbi:hypothetical protein PGUG_04373 [Meyerozyma guilliermondii ATCC 6260]|uniref:C2H2-type domain-containing protein n=1 Tax=Meyerozyma guilliermondii (strain ATCC 6260 / CBS 566 / DSM 6381 / JCM 1539 / NBRC 10279 / NRRL Y-324) TaxID=294746 RepID=A5DM72_PICGU|nr:uncharacterized protein PGUG_04373 [Meyerozyma guilliermondii ATCC 6260]EDK40275.2 hypothetical protein PGUG_04373 [Meyerozyma guilliermondii ATCC 6260]